MWEHKFLLFVLPNKAYLCFVLPRSTAKQDLCSHATVSPPPPVRAGGVLGECDDKGQDDRGEALWQDGGPGFAVHREKRFVYGERPKTNIRFLRIRILVQLQYQRTSLNTRLSRVSTSMLLKVFVVVSVSVAIDSVSVVDIPSVEAGSANRARRRSRSSATSVCPCPCPRPQSHGQEA